MSESAPADTPQEKSGDESTPDQPGAALVRIPDNKGILRDGAGRILPGQKSNNPGGRPKGIRARLEEIGREYGGLDAVIKGLFEIALGKASSAHRTSDRIKALELLAAYGFGRPMQTIDMNVDEKPTRGPTRASELPLERLLALRSVYQRTLAGESIIDAEIVEPRALPATTGPNAKTPSAPVLVDATPTGSGCTRAD